MERLLDRTFMRQHEGILPRYNPAFTSRRIGMSSQSGLSPDHIMQVGLGFWASKVLLSAVEIGVFTELARGPEQFEMLAGRLGLHPRSSRDFLDALVALGFLKRSGNEYSNTQETDFFLD